jgi:hypothetical protein
VGAAAASAVFGAQRTAVEQLDYNLLFRWFVGVFIAPQNQFGQLSRTYKKMLNSLQLK